MDPMSRTTDYSCKAARPVGVLVLCCSDNPGLPSLDELLPKPCSAGVRGQHTMIERSDWSLFPAPVNELDTPPPIGTSQCAAIDLVVELC
jgi:hypothetical protein